ncbi:MAG TPA: glycosyltransferase [Saprospiraceae bacterium]|nr:glycosyltransferase [Saprospiraceae bacterium]
MKVLLIPSWYSTNRNEIAGVFVKEQGKALIKRGIDINILFADLYLFNILNPRRWFKSSFVIENGVPVFRINGFYLPKRSLFLTRLWCKIYVKLFESYMHNHGRPDVMHVHSYFASMVALAIKKKYGVPYVITEHHSGFVDKSIPEWHYKIIPEVLDGADAIIALNIKLKEELERYTNKEIIIIPNLVDTTVFNYKKESIHTEFRLVSIGFLIKRKGHDLSIKALNNLIKSKRISVNTELIIIGEGKERSQLEQLILDLNLANNVSLLGKIDHDLLPDYLSNASIFISASYAETQGVAITQALCTGLPVISTSVGGLTEIINVGNGILIPTDNIDELANAIESLINNYSKYNKKKISEEAMKIYDPSIITDQLIEIYNNLINSTFSN